MSITVTIEDDVVSLELGFLFGERLRCTSFLETRLGSAVGALKGEFCGLLHEEFDVLVLALGLLAVGVGPLLALVALDPILAVILTEIYLLAVVAVMVVLVLLEAVLAEVLVGSLVDFYHLDWAARGAHIVHASFYQLRGAARRRSRWFLHFGRRLQLLPGWLLLFLRHIVQIALADVGLVGLGVANVVLEVLLVVVFLGHH